MKYSVFHVKIYCRQRGGVRGGGAKQVERRESERARRHFCRYQSEFEFGSDTRRHKGAGGRARKVCTGVCVRGGGGGVKQSQLVPTHLA